jgi:hypothetical protein
MKTYHRVATGRPNQDFRTVISQCISSEIWGAVSTYGSLFPTVRAYPGSLPNDKDGIEFTTAIPPTKGSSPPGETYWKLHTDSPLVQGREGSDFAAIGATIVKVRYRSVTSLNPRTEWIKK